MLFMIEKCYKLKRKFYCTTIRPAMSYEIKCWTIKSEQESKFNVAEMKTLC